MRGGEKFANIGLQDSSYQWKQSFLCFPYMREPVFNQKKRSLTDFTIISQSDGVSPWTSLLLSL